MKHEKVLYGKVNIPGSIHNGAECALIKEMVYPTHTTYLVGINTGLTQGAAIWLLESDINWD